jgi:hypothetical protein
MRPRLGAMTPFVGREHELRLLLDRWRKKRARTWVNWCWFPAKQEAVIHKLRSLYASVSIEMNMSARGIMFTASNLVGAIPSPSHPTSDRGIV